MTDEDVLRESVDHLARVLVLLRESVDHLARVLVLLGDVCEWQCSELEPVGSSFCFRSTYNLFRMAVFGTGTRGFQFGLKSTYSLFS